MPIKTSFETWSFGSKISLILIIIHVIIFFCFIYLIKTKKLKKEIKKKIIKYFLIVYFALCLIISPFAFLYFYTHVPVDDIVPPTIYIRLLDNMTPIKDAYCFADIWTKEGYTDNKPLTQVKIFRELDCFGRERCSKEYYEGYYRLNVTDSSYKKWDILFFTFWKLNKTIEGDFNISIVCRKNNYIAYTIMNKSDFPCSPIPLTGNYIAPSFYCSNDSKIIKKHFYNMNETEFDEYDSKAINFIIENYQNKTILANNKLEVVLDSCDAYKAYSCGVKPVGLMQDKKGYGDPYVFSDFIVGNCEERSWLIEKFKIDLILSRFELDKCPFMKEIYSDKDYIYEVTR